MATPAQSFLKSLRIARDGWRDDPAQMVIKAFLGLAIGQIFWRLGYDQLGLFMSPKLQVGPGQALAAAVYRRLPPGPRTAWTVKLIEIACDASKMPVERRLYLERGYVADIIGTLATQPLWSGIETAEKIAGAALHSERVDTPEQVQVSIGCIYGTLVRYAADLIIWRYGDRMYLACRRLINY
jgi:hypothetical protein